ncbi:hypothetical protein BG000_004159 [Podila horticola]|nr:hypothetical protein BG000_004159 [Podila horticola]
MEEEEEEEDVDDTSESLEEDKVSTKHALQKLRKGIVKIRRSPPRLEKFKRLTANADRKQGLFPLLDVRTCWGSTFTMLGRGLECKDAYCTMLLDDNLTKCILEEVEWCCLSALKELLEHFDKLTTKVCASKTYVTITLTVVVYNSLMEVIEKFIAQNKDRLPDICQGAQAAYDKLAQYYAATDNSPIYSVATAIHPAMCFRYWSDQRWGAKYEKYAKKAVRNVWKAQYTAITTADLSPVPLNDSDNELELSLLGYTTKPKGDELEELVSSPTVLEMPLVFWKKN